MSSGGERRWHRGLVARVIAYHLAVISLGLGALFGLSDWIVRAAAEEHQQRLVGDEARRIASRFPDASPGACPDRAYLVRLSTRSDVTLSRTGPPMAPTDEDLALAAPGEEGDPLMHSIRMSSRSWTVASVLVGPDRVLQVGLDDASVGALTHRLRFLLLGVFIALAAIITVGGGLLMRRGLRPLQELERAATEVIRRGELSVRVPRSGAGDELDHLSELFNRMLDRNERLMLGMREALDHVAHDLRTPLARLRVRAEVALGADDPSKWSEALADIVEESEQLNALLGTLMDVGAAEAGMLHVQRERVELADLVHQVVDVYDHVAEEAGLELAVDLADGLVVLGDAPRLRQALGNLVDNAIKFSREGGTVTICARPRGEEAVISVRDEGEGIPPEHIDRIWDRLYRADPSRGGEGFGLGLSMVKAIAEAHGGSAQVESRPGTGSTFELRIPRQAGGPTRG